MTVMFNTEMRVPKNISIVNNETTDAYIDVSKDRLAHPDFNASTLNFTWKIIAFDG